MRTDGKWNEEFIARLKHWIGPIGHKFFQGIIDKHGHLNVVIPGTGTPRIPHPVHMREGMSVRNKMRDLHTAMEHPHEDAHWYDNHWQSAVKECLGIPTICEHCDDSGSDYVLSQGHYTKQPCPHCKGGDTDGGED